ncbi:hypothetical protein [Leifsonia sp. 71-9]|uniref:hypothetical protein n=1 Tax=Leifsonia sp. 71-9 TaxID=1895934 RepID=UPI00092A3829|nr:hypothetical protein [Leifsonia sp. 71-9]OJX78885.1 MAG: hypothetical protein BGO91_12880 [Leifsonia sp. 71-9]
MAEENDGIADALDGQLRIALTVAAQLGARFARIREELARTRQAQTEQQNRELQARFDAERAAARAELAPVYERNWWDSANLEQIANVHETATAWHGIDPEADRAGERIAQEVRDRYGLDVQDLDADPSAVREALARAERARSEAAASRGESAVDIAETGAFLTAAETLDRMAEERQQQADERDERVAAENDRDVTDELRGDANANRVDAAEAFDSAERRDRFASSLEGKADREVIDARMTAAAGQARHPREAVTTAMTRAPKARKASTGQAPQRERNLSR